MSDQNQELDRPKSRKKACVVVLVVVVLAIVASLACLRILRCIIVNCDGPTRIPMPALPTELTALPVQAHSECSINWGWNQGGTYVWEYPGIFPTVIPDNSVLPTGFRGETLGKVRDCTEILVTDYAWSEVDGEFYVLIESERAAGWMPLEYVIFDIARRMKELESADVEIISRIMEKVDDPTFRFLRDLHFESPAMHSLFDVYIHEDWLIYVKSPCSEGDLSHRFFLHITPANWEDLPEEHSWRGFGIYDFYSSDLNVTSVINESGCIVALALPEHNILIIYTGQWEDLPEEHSWRGFGIYDFYSSDLNVTSVINESGCIVALALPEHNILIIYTGQVIREESAAGEVSWKGPIWDGAAIIAREVSK